jgi:hypothetical protein
VTKIIGIDFTSSPKTSKPITCVSCVFEGDVLRVCDFEEWQNFSDFEKALAVDGPWIAGIDFPFGQSRKFIENIGWPRNWASYVDHAYSLGRTRFRNSLDAYRAGRPVGEKEHRRVTDIAAGSISPQKLYGVPVGLMFFEGAHRLVKAGVTIPGLQSGDPLRVVVEAYPGLLARKIIGRTSYKSDAIKKQTNDKLAARRDLLSQIVGGAPLKSYGFHVAAPSTLADDPSGDGLDALIFAIQAGWSWVQRENQFGAPHKFDPLEGWIADPALVN